MKVVLGLTFRAVNNFHVMVRWWKKERRREGEKREKTERKGVRREG